ncbi:endonuclease [Hexamita inflata]|uniref:Endonuclease n=1 Tax=Hexamita inflata TaxID=28002 RepID=A0AA86PPV9_9EUKA|nr:endonuclease [Hexamita inflata]
MSECKVMSFNILYGTCVNSPLHKWDGRKQAVTGIIDMYKPDLIGTQEGLFWQLDYIRSVLPDYAQYGSSRNGYFDTNADEFCAILYNRNVFDLICGETFFLSDTPNVVSKLPGSAFNRIATIIKLQFKQQSKSQFWAVNTHLDYNSASAVRQTQAKILLKRITELNTEHLPVVLTGDFNSNSFDSVYTCFDQFSDCAEAAESFGTLKMSSFTDFLSVKTATKKQFGQRTHIDWIMTQKMHCARFEVGTEEPDGVKPSDHYPIMAVLQIE